MQGWREEDADGIVVFKYVLGFADSDSSDQYLLLFFISSLLGQRQGIKAARAIKQLLLFVDSIC